MPYFTMEYLKGGDPPRCSRARGALPPEACRIVFQVAEALDYAHLKGVIHRDLKPSNVMMLPDGALKVMDYGIARARQFGGLTTTGAFMGTPDYVAPETIAEGTGTDARSDLYSLGVVFYEALTGRKPFVGGHALRHAAASTCPSRHRRPRSHWPGTPPELESDGATSPGEGDPKDRYPERGSPPRGAPRVPEPRRLTPWTARRPSPCASLAVCCLDLAAASLEPADPRRRDPRRDGLRRRRAARRAADVGIGGDRVAAVGDLSKAEARTVIDATRPGRGPGLHQHADLVHRVPDRRRPVAGRDPPGRDHPGLRRGLVDGPAHRGHEEAR